jgi:cytochrome c-type biogenesis protein CcsB
MFVSSSLLLSVVTFVYGLSAVLYIVSVIFKTPVPARMAKWTAAAGFLGNLVGILLRWLEIARLGYGHAPLSNLYESLIFFAVCIAGMFLWVEFRHKKRAIGAFVMPLACLTMAYASLSPNVSDRIQPLIPALKSNWLIAHVITCFLGYAGFTIAFGISIMYLLRQREPAAAGVGGGIVGSFPDGDTLDDLTHKMVQFGFLFLTAGIITGGVWANSAWGRYWGWDPKETWSLITWFIYATLLHARLMRGWSGRRIAYISIVGFMAMLFTYFGVNLLPGLHSYGAS